MGNRAFRNPFLTGLWGPPSLPLGPPSSTPAGRRDTVQTGRRVPAFPWVASVEHPDRATEMNDAVVLALRLSEGLALDAFQQRFDVSFDAVYGTAAGELEDLGLLERGEVRLHISPRGRLLANEVFARLMAARTDAPPP